MSPTLNKSLTLLTSGPTYPFDKLFLAHLKFIKIPGTFFLFESTSMFALFSNSSILLILAIKKL